VLPEEAAGGGDDPRPMLGDLYFAHFHVCTS
jgi:hypothetical protein